MCCRVSNGYCLCWQQALTWGSGGGRGDVLGEGLSLEKTNAFSWVLISCGRPALAGQGRFPRAKEEKQPMPTLGAQ